MKKSLVVLCLGVCIGVTGAVEAMTVDFDDLADGVYTLDDLNAELAGVEFAGTTIGSPIPVKNGKVQLNWASWEYRVWENTCTLNFTEPVSDVSLELGSLTGGLLQADSFTMQAYTASGTLIGERYLSADAGAIARLGLSASGISSITFADSSGQNYHNESIFWDNLSFTPEGTDRPKCPPVNTPEPGTLILLSCGIIGLLACRRRRT